MERAKASNTPPFCIACIVAVNERTSLFIVIQCGPQRPVIDVIV